MYRCSNLTSEYVSASESFTSHDKAKDCGEAGSSQASADMGDSNSKRAAAFDVCATVDAIVGLSVGRETFGATVPGTVDDAGDAVVAVLLGATVGTRTLVGANEGACAGGRDKSLSKSPGGIVGSGAMVGIARVGPGA